MKPVPFPNRLDGAIARFRKLYGEGEVTVLRAPARINILGEHVDYVSYLPTASLPFGSAEHEMLMLFRAGGDGAVRGASMNPAFEPFEFSITGEPFSSEPWESQIFDRPAPAPHWQNYVKGAVFFARWKHGAAIDRGVSFLVDSTIPANSGASSSSALVVLGGAAIRLANQIEYRLDELARESAQAEWYPGTRGGALDHTAICLAQRGHAVHITHWNQRSELVPLPDEGFCWITFFSHPADKGREVMLEYNERAAVSRLIIPAFWAEVGMDLPETVTLDEMAHLHPEVFRECERAFPALVKERRKQPIKLLDRAKHHLTETVRVKAAVAIKDEISQPVDALMRVLGQLINLSHQSLRDLYEVSTPEVERLVEIISNDTQVYGARLMGGGFGGNALALTTAENAGALAARVQREFYAPRGRDAQSEGSVMISTPGDGLSLLDL
ncbi:MAG: galactokinase [Blastocatellia bacterium]